MWGLAADFQPVRRTSSCISLPACPGLGSRRNSAPQGAEHPQASGPATGEPGFQIMGAGFRVSDTVMQGPLAGQHQACKLEPVLHVQGQVRQLVVAPVPQLLMGCPFSPPAALSQLCLGGQSPVPLGCACSAVSILTWHSELARSCS